MMNGKNRQQTFVESVRVYCAVFNYKIVKHTKFPDQRLKKIESFAVQTCAFEVDVEQVQESDVFKPVAYY